MSVFTFSCMYIVTFCTKTSKPVFEIHIPPKKKNLHYKIFLRRFHFRKAQTASCNTSYVQMSPQWMKKAFSLLLQMHFTAVCKDNGFSLTSAELKINYTRCVLTACFIQNSSETRIKCNLKWKRWGLSQRKAKSYEGKNLQQVRTDVVWKVIQLVQTVKFNQTFSGPRKSLQVSHKNICRVTRMQREKWRGASWESTRGCRSKGSSGTEPRDWQKL